MGSPTAEAWTRLAEHLSLGERLGEGQVVEVAASTIKRVTGREPRLMTKFDSRESRPPALANATLLPVTNGSHVIVPGDGYADLEEASPRRWKPPAGVRSLVTLPFDTGPASESQALDMAGAAGILDDFLGDPQARLTIRGRLRAPRFAFDFRAVGGTIRLETQGVQVEVDAGLEGRQIHLIEAKLGTRTNFHVRQLYFPYRMWKELAPAKPVVPYFVAWSNRRFSLRRYDFDPPDSYHALRLVAATDYLVDDPAPVPSLDEVLAATDATPPPAGIPFPQADDLRKVVDVVDAVATGSTRRAEIAARQDFDARQAGYYGNAGAYLGLLRRAPGGFELSELGYRFARRSRDERHRLLLFELARRPVLRRALAHVCERRALPPAETVADWLAAETGLSGATPRRRALTVLAWTRWADQVTRQMPLG